MGCTLHDPVAPGRASPTSSAWLPTGWTPWSWKEQHKPHSALQLGEAHEDKLDQSVSAEESSAAWARLLAEVYEVDPLRCTRCGCQMRVLAVITDPQQVRRILRHLVKTGAAPPGLDPASVS
jgi:hypothetical protein